MSLKELEAYLWGAATYDPTCGSKKRRSSSCLCIKNNIFVKKMSIT